MTTEREEGAKKIVRWRRKSHLIAILLPRKEYISEHIEEPFFPVKIYGYPNNLEDVSRKKDI